MNKIILSDAFDFIKNTFKDDHDGHDYFHTMEVYKMATRIAEQENASLTIAQLAALLHDVDMRNYISEFLDEWAGIR